MRLAALRKDHPTQLFAAPVPPGNDLELVHYDAPLGKNVAYVTAVQKGPKRPAIIWIHGGWQWDISSLAWDSEPRNNDQSAVIFRASHIAELYPATRGANHNPGSAECFYGEVDDVLAAAEFLAARPDVDPERIYLGGHSTGGTLALLAAASSRRFRAVFAFGPIDDIRNYDRGFCLPDDVSDTEAELRAPGAFLSEIVSPTFVIEGERGHSEVLERMRARVGHAPVVLLEIPDADHFDVLWPGSFVVANAIHADAAATPSQSELGRLITQEAISAVLASVRREDEVGEDDTGGGS